ncbi:hypothetical protein ACLBVF_22370 [Pseudomonas aeruginosa]|uniref:hypothetical protein n=1 Tax=Pseudomonas aeruginosa TaxID=287 RepID=UPI001D0CEF91|nr:hypothetical protein [Pseudomonas aeruginosa]MDC8988092.1 hypothetical protein [Pseudomonas aeruginosa]MDW3578137.1 hypothetical protein [Pseudomonas aeruginosa]
MSHAIRRKPRSPPHKRPLFPAPARYLHIPTGIHWVVIDSLGNVLQLENIERRRRLITVSDLENTEAWRKIP